MKSLHIGNLYFITKNLNDVDKVYRTNDEAGRELDQKLNKFKSFALKDDAKPTSVQQKEIYLTTLQERFQEQETQFRTIVDSTIQKYISPTIIREFTNSSNKHVRERLLQELMKERNVFDQQTETFNTFNVTEKRKQDFANAQTIEDRQNIINAISEENDFGSLTSTQKPQLSKKRKEIEQEKNGSEREGPRTESERAKKGRERHTQRKCNKKRQ